MSDYSDIKDKADQIQNYLESQTSTNPDELQERIIVLMTYVAYSGEMFARAKRILRAKKSAEISKTIIAITKEQCLSASVQNALLDSICDEESYLVDYLERINRTATHQLDAMRSLPSYEKEQARLNKTGF